MSLPLLEKKTGASPRSPDTRAFSGDAELTADDHQSPTTFTPAADSAGARQAGPASSLDAAQTTAPRVVVVVAPASAASAGGAPSSSAAATAPAGTAPSSAADDAANKLALPRGSRVLVKGNARTKKELIGLECVVRKAVGLGGWHWLVSS